MRGDFALVEAGFPLGLPGGEGGGEDRWFCAGKAGGYPPELFCGGQFWFAGKVAADDGDWVRLAPWHGAVAEGGEQAASSIANDGLDVARMLLQFLYGRWVKSSRLFEGGGEVVGAGGRVLDHHHSETAHQNRCSPAGRHS
jgi:hypothetical protein